MTNIKGYLVECEGRSLFMRNKEDVLWAISDENYKVTPLAPLPPTDVYAEMSGAALVTNDTVERLQLLEQIYELEEKEIGLLKERLEEAVELVESIHEFASKQTNNIMESRGLLLLIAEACQKWLRPKED